MNNLETNTSKGPLLNTDHGYYSSALINLPVSEVYKLLKKKKQMKDLLQDLPLNLDNFLDLSLASAETTGADEFKIVFENSPEAKISGTLTFLLKRAPMEKGTLLTSEGKFQKLSFRDEEPSTLMYLFLKRLKSMLETGEIATIKGQPSGREELKKLH